MLKKANYLFSYFNIASKKSLNIELCDDVKEIILKKYHKKYIYDIISKVFYKFYKERVKNKNYIKCVDCKRYRHKDKIKLVECSLIIPFYKNICEKNCRFKYPCGHYNTPIPCNEFPGYFYMQNCSTCNLYQFIGFYWVGSPPFIS